MPQFTFDARLTINANVWIDADDLASAMAKFDQADFNWNPMQSEIVDWDRTGDVQCDDGSSTFTCEELER